ncbi:MULTISPECIES: phosphoglucosamine mutase [unclassified Nocardioides]|uniref:phosphoglucosamine mutase n=1 Tax=unclassified Nocardioides TaxID=2615069 RepID=UPI0007025C80|nr:MULTISPECIES: phosphoglucosamine mutase [unclassified Nocardioides]KRC59530.1 phosphoglucosamine mutase [Nocardioides sp. Root79]KRC68646.1 phosphoglucosamine mutase [Nocardioides sp. Root240]
MPRIFGTDGVRGLANDKLTAELALDLGVAAARVLVEHGDFDRPRPLAVVGRDTRISGQFLEHAVVAGLAAAGVDVLRLRVLPTPGVAYFTDALNADVGVVISASHNPMPDNGIKFLARGGVKLDDALEREIEEHLAQDWDRPTGAAVGRVQPYGPTVEEYAAHLVGTLDDPDTQPLAGLTVVLDCAHGAASEVGPHALRLAGATVITIGAEPDGLNINDGCGSTHLEPLRKAVLEHGADAGFAVDGDADRCLAVDHAGEVVDGDQIMGILALALKESGRLVDDTLVATVMSNLGLVQAMAAHGVTVRQTAVGDRYVLEDMRAGGYSLGGEQSGHVILRDHATTGDGLLTTLHVLQRMVRSGRSLQELAGVMTRLPQVLVNVSGVDRTRTDDEVLLAAVAEAESELGTTGRILLRPSGTEPLVRVMVEAPTAEQAEAVANDLADVVRERLSVS